jgi:hypothetical protein
MLIPIVSIPIGLIFNVYAWLMAIAIGAFYFVYGGILWEEYPYESWICIVFFLALSRAIKLLIKARDTQKLSKNEQDSISSSTLRVAQVICTLPVYFLVSTGLIRLFVVYFAQAATVAGLLFAGIFLIDYFKPFLRKTIEK